MESPSVLQTALDYLSEKVRPRAQEIDLSVEALREVLDGMARGDMLAMKRPAEYGGPDMPEEDFRYFQEEVARTSGALSFLQTQHQSAVSMIARCENEALKREYLPKMGDGGRLVGIGFSQLRRPGPPIMRAAECDGGYLVEGHVPWVTGWSFYPEFLLGAALPDGRSVLAVVPLSDVPGIKVNEPMRLAAMETAMTVTVDFEGFYVPEEKVTTVCPAGWIQNNDQINVALQRHFALGCARAGLDVVKAAAEKKNLDFLRVAHQALSDELDQCRAAASADSPTEQTTEERLEARAWSIELAVRCAHAGVAASGGAANSLAHPAQRIYREALVYTVSAQTTPIMEATLKRLTRRK